MVQASFFIGNRPEAALDEAAARAALAADRLPDTDGGGLEGRIDVSVDGSRPVEVTDDLAFLVPNLCLAALRRVEAEGRATVTMVSWPSRVHLVREGGDVRILDASEQELGRFPLAGLKTALRECARRFADYTGELAALDAHWSPLHAALSARLDEPA